MIKSISFIGAGNVATHMAKAFYKKGIAVDQIWSRNKATASILADEVGAEAIDQLDDIHSKSDLFFIAVPDDHIAEISAQLTDIIPTKSIVVHCSGSIGQDVLDDHNHFGVFYPLQTFSTTRKVKLKGIPILINGSSPEVKKRLSKLAKSISKTVKKMDDQQRKNVHISAVILNNFTNHLALLANEFADDQHIDFSLFQPLLKETIAKMYDIGPDKAQTGPAKRGDIETIETHLQLLANYPELQSIYRSLSKSIMQHENTGRKTN